MVYNIIFHYITTPYTKVVTNPFTTLLHTYKLPRHTHRLLKNKTRLSYIIYHTFFNILQHHTLQVVIHHSTTHLHIHTLPIQNKIGYLKNITSFSYIIHIVILHYITTPYTRSVINHFTNTSTHTQYQY